VRRLDLSKSYRGIPLYPERVSSHLLPSDPFRENSFALFA
jgi:hypothetical protein